MFLFRCKVFKLQMPVSEFRFDPSRRWRFDFAWPDKKIAVECEGGIWSGGRHTRGSGYQKDLEKYNSAALQGWSVFRFDSNAITSGKAIKVITEALKNEVKS